MDLQERKPWGADRNSAQGKRSKWKDFNCSENKGETQSTKGRIPKQELNKDQFKN